MSSSGYVRARRLPRRLRYERRPRPAVLTAAVLAAFYVVVAFLAPAELPWLFQRFVAITNGVLVLLVILFSFEDLSRRRGAVTADRWRKTLLVRCVAIALCAMTVVWWLSPAAPIKVSELQTPTAPASSQ